MAQYISNAALPTEFGEFHVFLFVDEDEKEHLALVKGDVADKRIPVRVHSRCLTGDALHSIRCDCRDQLTFSMKYVEESGAGIIVYMDQEGRGIGLRNKIKAYALQDQGADTVEANLKLGFKSDERTYKVAAEIINFFKPSEVELITNNPEKIKELRENGVNVVARIAPEAKVTPHNRKYLRTKKEKLGHMIDCEG
ncbi:MAG: GTP cyclohydrolase II [Candidatus Bilamarchaeaceae archaeon]